MDIFWEFINFGIFSHKHSESKFIEKMQINMSKYNYILISINFVKL